MRCIARIELGGKCFCYCEVGLTETTDELPPLSCVPFMQDFARMYGNPLLGKEYELNFDGLGKPFCPASLGCMFLV